MGEQRVVWALMNDCMGFWFLLRAPGPFSCYLLSLWSKKNNAMGPRTSSIVLSCSVTQRAGWSRQKSQEEAGPWTVHAAFPKDPVGYKPSCCSLVPAAGLETHAMNLNIYYSEFTV